MTGGPAAAEAEGLFELLASVGVGDFRDYRRETLLRGVGHRLAANSLPDMAAYLRLLERDPAEVDRLLDALVIGVTSFFRDAPVWDALERRVLPELAAGRAPGSMIRAWAAGVATGEEAWSLAMLLAIACEISSRDEAGFDVVASDVDAQAIDVAREGTYRREDVAVVPPALRAQFFRPDGDRVRVADELRARVRFEQHAVAGKTLAPREAVVASFHLVMFRNVLIYFDRRLQQKALDRLLSVLEPGGVLVLGPVESLLPGVAEALEPYPGLPADLRIFQNRAARP